jgi:hypothetical protein
MSEEATRKRYPNRKQEEVKVSAPNKLPKKKHPPTNGGNSGLNLKS